MSVWFTSDLHFDHNREFLYVPRGFSCVEDMNEALLQNLNQCVGRNDELYILGDIALGGPGNDVTKFLRQIPGKIHIVRGNHDTDMRLKAYSELSSVVEIQEALRLKVGKYRFFMCHYPALVCAPSVTNPKMGLIDLFGHTHQCDNFFNDMPMMYHVGVDSHDNRPVLLEQILEDIRHKGECCD